MPGANALGALGEDHFGHGNYFSDFRNLLRGRRQCFEREQVELADSRRC
jgi:hypothetical protein